MNIRRLLPFGFLALTGSFAACSGSDTTTATTGGGTVCVAGQQTNCKCFGDIDGTQVCLADGSGYGMCNCNTNSATTGGGTGGGGGATLCPNSVCDDSENCHTCEVDCGVCKPCDIAPKCKNVDIPPAKLTAMPQLDLTLEAASAKEDLARLTKQVAEGHPSVRIVAAALSAHVSGEPLVVSALRKSFAAHPQATSDMKAQLSRAGLVSPAKYTLEFPVAKLPVPQPSLGDADPPGGTLECGAPLLRIGVSEVKVPNTDATIGGDTIYCVTQTEAQNGGEIRIIGPTGSINDGQSQILSISAGIMWGQKAPVTPGGTLQITYDCYAQKDTSGYKALVDSIGKAAMQSGMAIPGDAGYVVQGIGGVAGIVGGALGLVKDSHLLNKQQTIPLDVQMQLTNGATWNIKASGKSSPFGTYEMGLVIKAWGCAEYGTL